MVTAPPPNCSVAYVFERIEVAKNTKVVWYLNDPTNSGGFEFDAADGIKFKNSTQTDFDSNGHHNSKKHQYTWKAKSGGTKADLRYDITVRANGQANPCAFIDPIIVNTD